MAVFTGFQRGVNLGGWISQFDRYDKEHFDTFITKDDIAHIANMGFDHVRVPVDYVLLEDEDGTPREDGYRYLSACRMWCAEHGLNMLIDLHECYGYSFDPLKDMDRERFFHDSELQERFLKLWKRLAERFSYWPEQVAFEPLNEIVLPEVAEPWNVIAAKFIKTVREVAPRNWLVIGGIRYSSVLSVPMLDFPLDDRIVYNFHCYEPLVFTHQGAYWLKDMPLDFRIGYPKTIQEYKDAGSFLDPNIEEGLYREGIPEIGPEFFEGLFTPAVEKARKDNVPLYCGEYGVIDRANTEDRERWLRDIRSAMDRLNIGRALWNYKEKDFGIVSNEEFRIKN